MSIASMKKRLSKLESERDRRLRTTTKEQRVEQIQRFVTELDRFGKENFPLAPTRWDEEGG